MKSIDLLNDSINRLHSDIIDLRDDIEDLHKKIDKLNDEHIVPLRIFKARVIIWATCLGLAGGAGGEKISKVFLNNEKQKTINVQPKEGIK